MDILSRRFHFVSMYDFIVVGAGLPGSRFAYHAATEGYDVALLDSDYCESLPPW